VRLACDKPYVVTALSVTVPAPLVPYLRAGLKREIRSRLSVLEDELGRDLDPETYSAALSRLWPATALFNLVGLENRPDQLDIEVDLGGSGRLLLKVLDTQHRLEVQRLQNAIADGVELLGDDVVDLGTLVSFIRRSTGVPSPDGPER
jgi:hypothetical protein